MLEDGRARLEVVLDAERVEGDLRHTLGHLVESAKYPGFRQGKGPPAVVLQRMGREEVFAETMREFLPAWVGEAISESRPQPGDRPSVDYESVPGEGEGFTFTAEFPLRPAGTLPEKLELEGGQEDGEIPAQEVDAGVARLRGPARRGPHVRGDRTRAARHDGRRDAPDAAAAARRLSRPEAAQPQRR